MPFRRSGALNYGVDCWNRELFLPKIEKDSYSFADGRPERRAGRKNRSIVPDIPGFSAAGGGPERAK